MNKPTPQEGCKCKGSLPKANFVHTLNTCYKYPQDNAMLQYSPTIGSDNEISSGSTSPSHTSEENQCDGCQRGLPLKDGIHTGEGYDRIGCTKKLYSKPHTSDWRVLKIVAKNGYIEESSSRAPKEWEQIPEIKAERPSFGEVSLQVYDGTRICQWNVRKGSPIWTSVGSMFVITSQSVEQEAEQRGNIAGYIRGRAKKVTEVRQQIKEIKRIEMDDLDIRKNMILDEVLSLNSLQL